MKKFLLILILIILPFGLTGCFKKEAKNEVEQKQVETSAQGGIKVNAPNTIMGWLKSGKGTECEVVTLEGDKITILSMDDKVKISGFPYVNMANPESGETIIGHSLTIGDMMYVWGGKNGMKMDMKKMEEISEEMGKKEDEEKTDTWKDMIQTWDDQNVDYDCTEKRINVSDFNIPNDVEFQDLSTFMEGMADVSTKTQNSLDNGGEIDLKALQEQTEALKAQYKIE